MPPRELAARPNGDQFVEFPTETLISEARCADLIVVEKNKARGISIGRPTTGLAILGAGRPFLVVPPAVKSLTGGPRRGRMEGYARGTAGRSGRTAISPRGEAGDDCGNLREGSDRNRAPSCR